MGASQQQKLSAVFSVCRQVEVPVGTEVSEPRWEWMLMRNQLSGEEQFMSTCGFGPI